jgi:hypothetical protein
MEDMKWHQLVAFCTVHSISFSQFSSFRIELAPDTAGHCDARALPLAMPHTPHKTHVHPMHTPARSIGPRAAL